MNTAEKTDRDLSIHDRKKPLSVCRADELPPGEKKLIMVRKRQIGVYNVDGEYYAVRNFCPHQWAPVCRGSQHGAVRSPAVGEFAFDCPGRILRCPWHGWEFDLADGSCLGDPTSRLATLPVTVEEGVVTVWT